MRFKVAAWSPKMDNEVDEVWNKGMTSEKGCQLIMLDYLKGTKLICVQSVYGSIYIRA